MTASRINQISPSAPSVQDMAYIAEHSILRSPSCGRVLDFSVVEPSLLTDTPNNLAMILQVSEADVLPRQPLRGALIDVFFTCLADSFPMIERGEVDLPGSSILLQQAVCFAGGLMRPSSLQWSHVETKVLYDKVKLLISLHYESNVTIVLKAMCLLTLWSPNSPNTVSLVGPWHATGSALRLAIQMGMHRKSVLLGKSDAKCRLKIIWMLHVSLTTTFGGDSMLSQIQASDCALSLIYGRPPMLRSDDLDIPALTKEDYDNPTQGAQVFMADVSLCRIMGEIAALASKGRPSPQQHYQFYDSLKLWVRDLPPELHLVRANGTRMPYHFSSFELYLAYLSTCIILQILSLGSRRRSLCSMTSIIAATTMADLYNDILCRDQTPFLTAIHGFWCTVAAISLLQYRPESPELETRRTASLDVICSVVCNLQDKFGLAFIASRKIAQLKSDRASVVDHQAPVGEEPSSPGHIRLDADELTHLGGLFPSLNQWCPDLEAMAASVDVASLENPTIPDPSTNMDPVLDEPGSILDELGGHSVFMDTLFNNNFFFGEMAFEGVEQSFEPGGSFLVRTTNPDQ